MRAPGEDDEPVIDRSDLVRRNRKADADQVVRRYQELRHLRRTGEEFGITRERVRQIVNRAGISTAPHPKPKPEKGARFCKQCGAPVYSNHARYCATHGTPQQRSWRRYQRMKADPERYAHWRELCNVSARRRRARKREQSSR
jgi:ribosomal protein L37E